MFGAEAGAGSYIFEIMSSAVLVAAYTTVASSAQALRLAQAALEANLAACAQLTPIESVYRWEGKVQQDAEVRVMFKTTAERVDALKALILQLHPYELPAFYALPVMAADERYSVWVEESVR